MNSVPETKIDEAIASVIEMISKNPTLYFSEVDLQSLFAEELMRIKGLDKLYNTDCTIGLNQKSEESDKKYKTTAVHREYGTTETNNARNDVVVFNPAKIIKINDPINLKIGKNYIIPDFTIEIGTEKSAGSASNYVEHLEKDIERVKNNVIKGYAIHIQRNKVSAGYLSKNKKKYDEYISSSAKIFQKLSPNTRALVVMLNVGNEKRKIFREGKLQLLKKSNDKYKFVGIPQSKIKLEVMELLK